MQKLFRILIVPFLMLFLSAGAAMADNITIFDGREDASQTGTGVGREVGETEPGMVNSLEWDLQAFHLDGNTLSMGGGFDFLNGVSGFNGLNGTEDYTSGDIFIDIDLSGDVYDYVLDLDWDDFSYDLYAIDGTSTLTKVGILPDNASSNPWKYESGGELLAGYSGNFIYDDTNLYGYEYYLTGFDLSFLGLDEEFLAHFTMGCGNDNLLGQGTTAPVPEPATMFLLGTGLIGIAGVGRKRLFKK